VSDVIDLSGEARALAEKCNEKHVRVVQAIISGEYSSNTKAYLSVYQDSGEESARRSVSDLLTIPDVKALHFQLREEKLMEGVLTRAEAMKRLTDMVRTDMSDLVSFIPKTVRRMNDATGELEEVEVSTWEFHDSAKLTPEALASISEIASSKEGVKLKIHDAKAAIKQLSEMSGWEAPKKIQHSGSLVSTDKDMTLEEADRIYQDNLKALRG